MRNVAPSLVERLEKAVRMEGKGELEQARIRYRAVVDYDPNGLEALSLLGKVENKLGDHNAAFFHLRRAARMAPSRADIHLGVGDALEGVGEKRRAVEAYLNAVNADPGFAPAYVSLGKVFAENGQSTQAERAFETARQLGAEFPEVHYQLGLQYKACGRLAAALEAFEVALRLGGEFTDIHLLLTDILTQAGEYSKALVHAHKQLRLDAKNTQAWTSLAGVLLETKSFDEAMNACQMALQCDPRNSVALAQIGRIHFSRQDIKGAKRSFDAAIKMDAGNNVALIGLAEVCEYQGQYDEALRYIRDAGDPKEFPLNTALLCSRVLQSRGQSDGAIRLLNYRLDKRLDHEDGRSQCHYMLARLHEEQQRYKQALAHYQNANDLSRGKQDAKWDTDRVNQMLAFFTLSELTKLSSATNQSCEMVFVVALPGFHTELLRELLRGFTKIHLSSRKITLVDVANNMPQHLASARQFPATLRDARSAELQRIANHFVHANSGGEVNYDVMVDIDPNNASLLGMAKLLFPRVRVVQLNREIRSAALDIYTQDQREQRRSFSMSIQDIAGFAADQGRAMSHWSKLNQFEVLQVHCEALMSDPMAVLKKISQFIGFHADETLQTKSVGFNKFDGIMQRARLHSARVERFVEHIRATNSSVFSAIDRH